MPPSEWEVRYTQKTMDTWLSTPCPYDEKIKRLDVGVASLKRSLRPHMQSRSLRNGKTFYLSASVRSSWKMLDKSIRKKDPSLRLPNTMQFILLDLLMKTRKALSASELS